LGIAWDRHWLIVGGGYGIYLKTEYIKTNRISTLLTERPESRSTNDLDLFLRPEFLIESKRLLPLAAALKKLDYQVIETARNYQFVKNDTAGKGVIKIDFLTGPQSCFQGTNVKTDERRVRPNPSVGIHAHPVDEVPTLQEELLPVMLSGPRSNGEGWESEIFLPHPYSFLMMKIFAFRDRLNDQLKEFSRYHALDLYSIVACINEREWNAFDGFRKRLENEPHVVEAANIVQEYFSSTNKLGIIRMRESRYFRPELQFNDFISILKELFPK
jgi:hypothetical protein